MRGPAALIWCAGLLGALNAAPSYYWAFGGDALLESIGQWLITLRAEMPVLTGAALLGIALAKTLATVIPLLAARSLYSGSAASAAARPAAPGPSTPASATTESERDRSRRVLWWNLSRVIAAGLILYGAAGLVVNAGLLLWPGMELQDPSARWGQALLWYPMLLLWGLVLAAGLRRLRATLSA